MGVSTRPERESDPDVHPLAGFQHDVDVTKFDTPTGRLAVVGLAVLVAFVAGSRGAPEAVAAATAKLHAQCDRRTAAAAA